MTPRMLCVVLVMGVALAGCATAPPQKGVPGLMQRCESATCPIYATVIGGQLKVSDERVEVPESNPNAAIVWLLQTNGYEFRQGSIRFKGGNVATCNANFVNHSHSKKVYNLTDIWRDRVECKYEITVYDSAGNPIPLDPVIANN